MQAKKNLPGESLNESIKSMARRDPSFNDFLRNFKAKNEQNWASIVDMTQEDQEDALLARSPEYRKNEMVMLEEFRRRKMYKDFYDKQYGLNKEMQRRVGEKDTDLLMSDEKKNL